MQHGNTVKVFVYGSLKVGFSNHGVVERYVLDVKPGTVDGFRMLNLGAYPGAVPVGEGESRSIRGEIMLLTDPERAMRNLDGLEGYPHFYNRKVVTVRLDDGNTDAAWIYMLNRADWARNVVMPDEHGVANWERPRSLWGR